MVAHGPGPRFCPHAAAAIFLGLFAGGILLEPVIIDDSVFQGHPKPLAREV